MSENIYDLMVVLGFLFENDDGNNNINNNNNNNNDNNKKNKNKNKEHSIFKILDAKSLLKEGNIPLSKKIRSKNEEQSGRKRSIKNKGQSKKKRRKTKTKKKSTPDKFIVIDDD